MRDKWVITAINKLMGRREEISGPMTKEAAQERLEREESSRRYQRYQTHSRLRVERRLPEQLTINFKDNE